MSLCQVQRQILSILSKNLASHHPQLVPTATIAGKISMRQPQLHQLLKDMNRLGVIQSDDDMRYSLITRKGLHYLGEQRMSVSGGSGQV